MLRHPFQVSLTLADGTIIPVAKRSTSDKAENQADDIRNALGRYGERAGIVVSVTNLNSAPSPVRPFRG